MKKTMILSFLSILILMPACAMYWDGLYETEYRVYRIIFRVQPDDAHILLNGRFIGETFEFSTSYSALELTSKNHEIVIKKKGYKEEMIDLHQYSSRNIVIQLQMKEDNALIPETRKEKPVPKTEKPEYMAKTEPVKEPVTESKSQVESNLSSINITLEIQPVDAAIYLNGKFWGIVPETGKIENLKLKSGTYTLEVIKPGYKSSKRTIEIKGQKLIKITIKLEKPPVIHQ
jgi:hypothetical protein